MPTYKKNNKKQKKNKKEHRNIADHYNNWALKKSIFIFFLLAEK